MKKILFFGLFLALFCSQLVFSQSDTVLVPMSDLLRLQALLKSSMQQQESAMQQSSELQKIINASETELKGLKLDLTLLRSELKDWKNISEAQASEINRLFPILEEQDRISKRQAELLGLTLASNKRMKITLAIGIPAAVVAGGVITWAFLH